MKRVIAIVLSILIFGVFMVGCVSERRIKEVLGSVERYQYPIDVTSENWFDYSVTEKRSMLMIPQETLENMSDLQLLYATADYPFFIDASIYGFDTEALAIFAQHCTAFGELLSRESFLKTLKTYGKAVAQEYISDYTNATSIARADLILSLMEVYTGNRPDIVSSEEADRIHQHHSVPDPE